jgi:hypothetical protein
MFNLSWLILNLSENGMGPMQHRYVLGKASSSSPGAKFQIASRKNELV